LFLNRDVQTLDRQIVIDHVSEIVLKYAGRRMTSRLLRDASLEAHPEDYHFVEVLMAPDREVHARGLRPQLR
jgi:hypothetical protein